MIYRNKTARELNYVYGKHRPFMYNKNVKKTFEILRSEITFLMDLYMYMQKYISLHNNVMQRLLN